MGCKHSAVGETKKGKKNADVSLKKPSQENNGKLFAMNELTQLFISYEKISFEKFHLLHGPEKSQLFCPFLPFNTQLFLHFTKFQITPAQLQLELKLSIFDISAKGQKLLIKTSNIKAEVSEDMLIEITPGEKIEKGKYYLFEIDCELPWIRINACLGPAMDMVDEVKSIEKAPQLKQNKGDWLSYSTSGAFSLTGITVTSGQELNTHEVAINKFDFGSRYDVHFTNLSGLQHYKKEDDDEDEYVQIGLTMLVINSATGQLVYSQMDIVPEGVELMLEDAKELSLFVAIGSDEFKKMEEKFVWVCHGWDRKSNNPMNQFFSIVNFEVKNECNEVVKILGFEQENNKVKVEIFGKTNWMVNQRYFVCVNQTLEAMVKENLNSFINLKLIFDKDQQKDQENALYLLKDGQQTLTYWKIKEMHKFAN